uniref:Globin domain-containing protein n=1 Tax=Podarcis muralis TaxID=64176 RepID=A0A670ID30_PODMU
IVHWTAKEKQLINTACSKVNMAAISGDILARILVVYPWCQMLFGIFGNPLQPSLSLGTSPALFPQGQGGFFRAVKEAFSKLRELLCDKLHMDPVNFRVRLLPTPRHHRATPSPGKEFTPACHHAFHKLVGVTAHALARRSH